MKKEKNECPLDGDSTNNCADCVYSVDYKLNKKTKECERLKN